jgi:hypothetical protein
MKKAVSIAGAITVALFVIPAALAQSQPPNQAAATSGATLSSSEKVRENPAAQYLLVKTVVAQASGLLDARAKPIEPEGYNLLKYCWTAENVLGDWAERSGLTGT